MGDGPLFAAAARWASATLQGNPGKEQIAAALGNMKTVVFIAGQSKEALEERRIWLYLYINK